MNYENLVPVIGTIETIRLRSSSCDEYVLSLDTPEGPVTIILTSDTFIVDSLQMYQGMRIAAFYDSTAPALLIYPPQHQATLITVLQEEDSVVLKYFDTTLTAEDQSLRLNVEPSTDVTSKNGQMYACNPANNYLLVYYSAATRSIPPQTTPNRIIVF